MIQFTINDMTCNHCVGTITKTIAQVDAAAVATFDLASHQVTINSAVAAEVFAKAIAEAGYTPDQ